MVKKNPDAVQRLAGLLDYQGERPVVVEAAVDVAAEAY